MRRITVQIVDSRNTIEMTVTVRSQVEIIFHSSLNTQVLRTIRGDVEVHLQDLRLGILLCQANGKRCFSNLTIECLSSIASEIFDYLLGNRTSTALDGTHLSILGSRT